VKVQSALAKKLAAMKPDERVAYIHQHPEVIPQLTGQNQ